MEQLTNGVVPVDASVAQEPPKDERNFFEKAGDAIGEYVDQGIDFAKNVQEQFTKIDTGEDYSLDNTDEYSKLIIEEANKTPLTRVVDSVGDFFTKALQLPNIMLNEGEDSFMKKFTGTDVFKSSQSAETANEIIKNFYARDDVINEKDQNKLALLQEDLYNKIRPLIKPEKQQSDLDIQNAMKELSVFKQMERQQKETEADKLNFMIEKEVQDVVNKKYVGGTGYYNQGLIESFKRGAAQELNEVYQMKKDLQISALEMGIDKGEVNERIAKLDKIIDVKKKQIDNALQAAYTDENAFKEDTTGRLNIYNKAFKDIPKEDVNLLLDYENSTTKDINTLLNVNRLNQLKKGGISDRLGAGISGIQGTFGLAFDTLDTALGIKPLAQGLAGRSYSVDNKESMLNALQSDENYLSVANRTGAAYVLETALYNFDDIGQVILGGGIMNKASGINKVVKMLDKVDGKVATSIATGAKGLIESYAYNNQLSMAANELNTDDYQTMNAILDPFSENVINFASYAIGNKVADFGWKYTSMNEARAFQTYMEKNGVPEFKKMDTEKVQDMLRGTKLLINNTAVAKDLTSSPDKLREAIKGIHEQIRDTGSYQYNGDGIIVTEYTDSIRKATSPAYLFNNMKNILNKPDNKYLNDLLKGYINEPKQFIKPLKQEEQNIVQSSVSKIQGLYKTYNNTTDQLIKNDLIEKMQLEGVNINNVIKGFQPGEVRRVKIFDLNTNKETTAEIDVQSDKISIKGIKNNQWMLQETKYNETDAIKLKELLSVEGLRVESNLDRENILQQVAEITNLSTDDFNLGLFNVETFKSADGKQVVKIKANENSLVDVQNLRLAQKGMGRTEVLNLLINGKDFQTNIKDMQDYESILMSILPIIDGTIIKNKTALSDFRDAARLFTTSTVATGMFKELSENGIKNQSLTQILLEAAIKWEDNQLVVGKIMRLDDSTLGNVSRAELIATIFTGSVNNVIQSPEDYFKIFNSIGVKDLSKIVGFDMKYYDKKVKAIMDRIKKFDANSGAVFQKEFLTLNKIVSNAVMHETVTSDIYKKINKAYVSIPDTYNEIKHARDNTIKKMKELYGIDKGIKTVNSLIRELKNKIKELEKSNGDKDYINKIKIQIDKIENSGIDISYKKELEDVVRNVKLATDMETLLKTKAQIFDIMKSMRDSSDLLTSDESIREFLKQYQVAYINKHMSITGVSDNKETINNLNGIYQILEGMNNNSKTYIGYIKPNLEDIGNYGDEPHKNTIVNTFSYENSGSRFYQDLLDESAEVLKEEGLDINGLKNQSIDKNDFQVRLNNTEVGQNISAIGGIFDNVDLDPVSIYGMRTKISDPKLKLIDRYTIVNGYILNIQKYLISKGMYNDEHRKAVEAVQAKYILEATSSYIDVTNDVTKGLATVEPFIKSVLSGKYIGDLGVDIIKGISTIITEAGSSALQGKNIKESVKDGIDVLLGNNNFEKAQTLLNKMLLENTPFNALLKSQGLTYNDIAGGLIDKFKNISIGTKLKLSESDAYKNIYKITDKKISDVTDSTKKYVEGFIDLITKDDKIKESLITKLSLFGNDISEKATDKLNNLVLETIIEHAPEFLFKNIKFTDWNDVKKGFKELVSAKGLLDIDGLASGVKINMFNISDSDLDESIKLLKKFGIKQSSIDELDNQLKKEGDYSNSSRFRNYMSELIIEKTEGNTRTDEDIKSMTEFLYDAMFRQYNFLVDESKIFTNIKYDLSKAPDVNKGIAIVNKMYDRISEALKKDNVEFDKEDGTKITLNEILDKNEIAIRENIMNGLREKNSSIFRDVTILNGFNEGKKTELTEHSDGINKILTMKTLVNTEKLFTNLAKEKTGIGIPTSIFKYDKVEQIEYVESFFNYLTKDTQLEKNQAQTIYTIVNNLKYIQKKSGLDNLKFTDIVWKDFGISDNIDSKVFDKIVGIKTIGDNYIPAPTFGEEANKGFFINPSNELVMDVIESELSKQGGKVYKKGDKSWYDINKELDNKVFYDLRKVLQIEEEDKAKFAKRFKQSLAGGNGLLDKEEKVLSFSLQDTTLWNFYDLTKFFTKEGLKISEDDEERLTSLLKADPKKKSYSLTDDEINWIIKTIGSENIGNMDIQDSYKTIEQLKGKEIKSIYDNFLKDISTKNINGKDNIIDTLKTEFNELGLGGSYSKENIDKILNKVNNGINKINSYHDLFLPKVDKDYLMSYLNKVKDELNSITEQDAFVPGKKGVDIKELLQTGDKVKKRNLLLYAMSKNNNAVKRLIKSGIGNNKVELNYLNILEQDGNDLFKIIGDYLGKESFDGMGYMSQGLAIKYFESRTGIKYVESKHKEYLKDLKAHILGDGVLEKTRQEYLSNEMQNIFDEEIKRLAKDNGFDYNSNYTISFMSGIKLGKDFKEKKFTKVDGKELLNQGVKTKILGYREISSNDIKIAASNAITDKETQTISMQYLAGQDSVMNQAIQNISISGKVNKVNSEKKRFDTNKSLSDNKGFHNRETLNEYANESEKELFNLLKGISDDGGSLKLSGGEMYKTKGGEWKKLEEDTFYISESKFNSLKEHGSLIQIGKDIDGKPIYGALGFRNPVAGPYNISLGKIAIDYDAHGKNLKISPSDTFLKKEGDFDADTVVLLTPSKGGHVYKSLFISALKQTSLEYKHGLDYLTANGDISVLENAIDIEYEKATKELVEQINKGEFFNKFIPTEQAGASGDEELKKSKFSTETMQGALIESSVAKEKIGTVSVSQEWLYYIRNSLEEYSVTQNEDLGDVSVGYLNVKDIYDMVDLKNKKFYAKFASILQATLDFAKSEDKFDPKWLEKEIGPMLKETGEGINKEENLKAIIGTIEDWSRGIKRFKSLETKEFLEMNIRELRLPPVMEKRYMQIQQAMKNIQSFKENNEGIEMAIRDLYIKKLMDFKIEEKYSNYTKDYFNGVLPIEQRKELIDGLATTNLRTINSYFDLETLLLDKEFKTGKVEIDFQEGSYQANMLKDFIKLSNPGKDRNVGTLRVNKGDQESFSIVSSRGKGVKFVINANIYSKTDLLNKYGDLLKFENEKDQVVNSLVLKVMGYNKSSHIFDEARRTEEVLTNVNMLKSLSINARNDKLKGLNLEQLNLLEKIGVKFDTDEYKFVTDLVDTKDFNEFIDNYNLEVQQIGNTYEASIFTKDTFEKEIDNIIKEVKIKNNVSDAILNLYNNESLQIKSRNRLTSIHIDAEGNIINGNKITTPTVEVTSNISNVFTSLMRDPNAKQYRDTIMQLTYDLNPVNAISTIKELEDVVMAFADNYSLSIGDKLAKFAPDIAIRFHSIRDNIRSNDLKIILDNVLSLRKTYEGKINEYYRNIIENNLFMNLANGKSTTNTSFIAREEDRLVEGLEANFNSYQEGLKNILVKSNLYNLIKTSKYSTNRLTKDTTSSHLMNYLEIQNGKLEGVLSEFGIKSKTDLIDHINKHPINIGRKLNTDEIENLAKEILDENNKHWFWKFLRLVKSNMYTLAFSPILVPAAFTVTILQMIPDFFINISKKSKSFNDARVNQLLKDHNILDSEVVNYVNNIHEAMDQSVIQKPLRWIFNILRSASNNATYKKTASTIELMMTNGFAINDILLGPLRRRTAGTRAFDTIADAVGGVDAFFLKYGDDPAQLSKVMDLVRLQAHTQFQDLSGGSSTARLMQTTVFSSKYHNLWNFMQTWSTSMVSQHIKASSDFYSMSRYLIKGDTKKAGIHFKQLSQYVSGQLKMNLSIAYVLAKYQMVYNENEGQDGEYDIWSYVKTLNNTIAGLESFSPIGAGIGFTERFDINQGGLYNMAMLSQEVTGRFGREFNLPKNITNYVINATKSGLNGEQILDGVYDILSDRTNGFIRYNKFEMEDGYSQDTYTTNLFGVATGVGDLTSYQKFKEDARKYGNHRAFQELSDHGLLAAMFGSSGYWKMASSLYSNDSSFALYEQMVKEIYNVRGKDDLLQKLIATGMDKDILNKIMLSGDKLNKDIVKEMFNAMTGYSARGLGEFIQSESGLTGFQFNSWDKGANIIDNLVISQLNEKYGKGIVDAIIQNDFGTISKFVQAKLGPDMLNSLYNTGNKDVDEAELRKMLLIASEKSELSIPTLVSTLVWDKAYEYEKKGLDKTTAQYLSIQNYGSLANGNLGMVNDVANIYTKEKYGDKLKALFNPEFKKQFSNSLENKLLIDMAVGRAFYEEGDTESAELRGDMTSIFNSTYKNMKEKNEGKLTKEDASKLMLDYEYVNGELAKLNGKVDPLKLYHYREGVMLSLLQKPDLLAEIEDNVDFNKQFSDVKDNLTLRFLKFAGEKKAYDLEGFEDLVKEKYNYKVGVSKGGYGGSGFNSFRQSSKPFTKGGSNGFNNGSGKPFINRAIDRGLNSNNPTIQLLQNNPFPGASYGPKMYNEGIKQGMNKLYKEFYQQYSKDLVKRNPEFINRGLFSRKQRAEMIGMQSRFGRKDFKFIPNAPYSKLSKGLIPGWAYNKE